MASLIFAASYLTYNKIKTKREERKEKKRKGYAARYSELQREHRRGAEEKQLHEWQRTRDSNSNRHAEVPTSPARSAEARGRRSSSSGSLRSEEEKTDGPNTWVDEVLKERSGGGIQDTSRSGQEEAKVQSLL